MPFENNNFRKYFQELAYVNATPQNTSGINTIIFKIVSENDMIRSNVNARLPVSEHCVYKTNVLLGRGSQIFPSRSHYYLRV